MSQTLAVHASRLRAREPWHHLAAVCGSGHQAQQFVSRAPLKTTLYDQNSNDTGSAINSQNYTSSTFSAYDDQGADDFTIPKGEHWTITEVDVTGQYFNGTGRATSEDVTPRSS